MINLVGPDGRFRGVEVAHADPAKAELARRLMARTYPVRRGQAHGVSKVLTTRRPELTPRVTDEMLRALAHDPEHLETLRAVGIVSSLRVPLVARDRVLGAVSLVMAESGRRYGPEDLPAAEELARRVATAIDNARLYAAAQRAREAAERATERIARLQSVTAALARALTPADITRAVVEEGLGALGARSGLLALVDETGAEVDLVGAVGYGEEALARWRRFPITTRGPLADAIRTSEPVWLGGTGGRPARDPELLPVSNSIRPHASASVPLLVEGRTIGAIGFAFDEPRPFGGDDRAFLVTLARQCALALERARLYEAERRGREAAEAARQRAGFLAEATARMTSSLDYEATLRNVARMAVPRIADLCIIDLVQPDGPTRWVAAAHVDPAVEAAVGAALPRYPVPAAADGGEARLVADVSGAAAGPAAVEARRLAFLRSLRIRSLITAPLVARGKALGVVTFATSVSGRRYGEADLETARDLAQRAALAVDNARLFREAQQAVREAQAAARARDEFLARASHELRTPLTSAIGSVRFLRRAVTGALKEPPEALIEMANRNLTAMLALVNDLLDATSFSLGADSIASGPVDVAAVVASGIDLMGAQAREKGVGLASRVPPSLRVTGDALKLEQVLVNLLANAVKFTPAGGRVVVEAAAVDGAALIRVRDTGVGIASEHLERVFEPFFQVPDGRPPAGPDRRARRGRGTGLGLAICRQIVTLHGGRIHAESEGPDRGSTFVVTLPGLLSGAGPRAA
jgi:signal transduction histidine kinase